MKLEMHRDDAELAFLMAHDTDSFNRWEAAQARRHKALRHKA